MKTLVDVMLHRAREKPRSDAYLILRDDGTDDMRVSYEDLDRKARSVAAYLQALGLEGERILLLYPPGLEFIGAFMGCLYAGAIAVPAHPPGQARSVERLQTLAADCRPALGLTTGLLKSRLQQGRGGGLGDLRLVDTETLGPELESRWHPEEIKPSQLAFLQYTSGSTSAPKGVMVSHHNLMYTQSLIQEAFGQTSDSVVVSWLPFYHDMGLIGGVLQPMFTGARCILMPPMQFLQQPLRWLQAISKYRATTSGGPDFAYDYCVQKITAEQRKGLDLSCWRVAFSGSEPVRAATLERFAREFAACGFREEAFQPCYGLAEATLLVSGFRRSSSPVVRAFCSDGLRRNIAVQAQSDSSKATKLVSSGAVSPADRVVIADPESLSSCPDRHIGEVWVSGNAVAGGYWQQPAETEAVFGARLRGEQERAFLRTGDLGFLDDGELFITGRLKDLIIIRGVNHFPQDIEETVCGCHPCLRSAGGAAFSIIDATQQEKLVIVQEAEKRPDIDYSAVINQIRTDVASRHEVQAHAIVLIRAGTIPKTSSGKIQRRASRDAFLDSRLSVIAEWRYSGDPAAPQTPLAGDPLESLESIRTWLVGDMATLLGVDPATIDPDLPVSHCGLDSLTAIEMTHRMEALGIVLPVTRLLETATITGIASEILARPRNELPQPSLPALPARSRYPLSYGQRALWFLQRMSPENSAYNLSIAVQVRGPLDRRALRSAFQELAARHASLRSTFGEIDGGPAQFVHEVLEPSYAGHDAATWTAGTLSARMEREMNSPFDLEAGPLLRIALYERGEQQPVLQVTAHHLVADFWSLAVALEEIARSYAVAISNVEAPPLVPSPAYSDFIERESALLAGPEGGRLWNYWRQRLEGELPVCELPADRPRDGSQTSAGKTERMRLGGGLVTDLRRLARERGCTLYMVLLAAFDALLFRYTECDDILIGSPAAGRISSSFSRLVGYCVNPLPLRTRIDPNSSSFELMAAVREVVTGAFDHQQYPFPLLVEKLQPERTSFRKTLFQMMFTFLGKVPGHSEGAVPLALGEPGARVKVHDLEFESLSLDEQATDFDLTLIAGDAGAEIAVALHYSSDLFDPVTMARMLGHWQSVLKNMVAAPEKPLSDIQLISALEMAELTSTGAGPLVSGPAPRCIHELFEDLVQHEPERTAIVFGSEEISYDHLNRRANQLAHHLRSLGAGPDVPVGICLDRSTEMVIALLATLKSGSAYVPLDPGYPKDRLAYMVEDAGISLIVTTRRRSDLFPPAQAITVCLDAESAAIARWFPANLSRTAGPENMAYVIYTSGSTGRPKGVMITHRNVSNFFAGMDGAIGGGPGAWLAVTSISFDISVLELLWTLSHGFQVVISRDRMPGRESKRTTVSSRRKLDFSLFYFAATDSLEGDNKYRLLLESAKFADEHGFQAVWTPERHFHSFGGLYPNPSVTGAALAAVTARVRIRAGSVVMPLHHPVRVAEEWSVVDNLSNGRVDVSFASGWHTDDFVLAPECYAERKEQMVRGIETVRKLWRGQEIRACNGSGQEIPIRISPRPCQPELPIWITAAGSNETFRLAGELKAGLLTHLLGQSIEELEEKIAVYRAAWKKSGASGEGHVTLMLHTFVGEDMDTVRETVRGPFCDYLRHSVSLISNFARSLNIDIGSNNCSAADMDALLQYAFDRYFQTSALLGTPETCLEMAYRLRDIGVDEVACLIDFGISNDSVMRGLEGLNSLREKVAQESELPQRKITHLQCTPSMARMLVADPQSAEIVASVDTLLLGGEAVTPALLETLPPSARREIYNMYGPTETTVWSAVEQLESPAREVSLGRPIVNTQIHILDRYLNPMPLGMPGEICIGGAGLARGYLGRPDLTAAQFVPDPLSHTHGARLYRTGDRGRWRHGGKLEFLGRLDFQVKIRGHRVECGEIEACLAGHPGIRDVAVNVFRDAGGDASLAAYVVAESIPPPSIQELREFIGGKLPEYMVPSHFVTLPELPLTPNGKIDRNRLPGVGQSRIQPDEEYAAPGNALEQVLADLWSELLNVEKVGIHSSFFALGGHSLLATALVSRLREVLQVELSLQTFFKNPTVALLSEAMLRENGERLKRTAEILDAITRLPEEEVEIALRAQSAQPQP